MAVSQPIVLFCGDLGPSGVSRNVVNFANALTRRGLRVEVLCLAGGQFQNKLESAKLTLLGRKAKWRPAALALALPALRRRLRTLRPALVVSMGNHAHLALWTALRGQPETPRVYRISNDLQHDGEAGLGQFFRRVGLQLIAADADRLLCVSDQLALHPDLIAARRQSRVATTENGVDIHAVRQDSQQAPQHPWALSGQRYVIAVGRIHSQKNYETLIEAMALVRQGDADLRLLIVGGGSDRAEKKLRALVHELGLNDYVELAGPVSNPLPLIKAAAAYVLPSRWEGASNALLEALACEVPIVASATAGNAAKVLAYGQYGLLIPATNAQAMAQAILRQIDRETRIVPGHRADDYSLEKSMHTVASILMDLCPGGASPAPAANAQSA